MPTTAVIVVAAGSGTRLDAGAPKALVNIDGHSILHHALRSVSIVDPAQVIVVAPAGHEAEVEFEMLAVMGNPRGRASCVTGGATRQASVAAGLAVLHPGIDIVLVHDAARPLAPPVVFEKVAAAVTGQEGVIPALPVVDSLKRVANDEVSDAVDRAGLVVAQTPQGFPRHALQDAYARAIAAGEEYSDDAGLYAAAGHRVRHIAGAAEAFKITTPADLARARQLRHPAPRIGVGTDVHAFGGEGTLWLAGLEWPGEPALSGHSDGDVVAHAIVDALLAAAALGDIGEHFGTSHPEFAGAHAEVFLARTRELVHEAGFAIGNVSVQFHGERPRFAARRDEAQRALSAALGGAPVSVSATTTDGLGFTGRGEGISATAIALLLSQG